MKQHKYISFEKKYWFLKLKTYLDTGLGVTNYLKYFVVTILIGKSLDNILIGAVIYAVICFIIGYLFYKFKWVEAQMEVSNRFNRLAKELRKALKNKKI